ncbi:MAG: hypothetical protein HY033_08970 [Ignavibacteriae bacterium]|nr:hypothetical protein [Ignavibacteria bacterium]MBI3365022.1 hypothetical protein [Ignavibacteriota bacterium]
MKSFLFLFCFAAITCAPGPVETVPLSQEFDLTVEERAAIQGESLNIIFTRVDEDSRCPEGVECLWEGNARIRLRLERPNAIAMDAVLNTTLDPRSISFAGYRIDLKRLTPYPKIGGRIDPRSYVARLFVTK